MAKKYLTNNTAFLQIAEDEKPREKALRNGIHTLENEELMALIFGTGIKGLSVIDMCKEILSQYDNHISDLANLPPKEFIRRHKGIGPAKALTLLAGIQLGLRAAKDAMQKKDVQILSSQTAYEYMRDRMQTLDHEEFWALFLTNRATVMRAEFIASGGQASTVVDNKILMRRALDVKCTRMIVFHNHPSGTLSPSLQDDKLTRKLKDACAIFDIRLDDHIIIAPNGYWSYNDNGRL